MEATLTRGGGLDGTAQTIRVWTNGSHAAASWQRSNAQGSRTVRLPSDTLDRILVQLDSLAGVVPAAVPDTGVMQRICGDVVTTQVRVRRGSRVRTANEECPHLGPALVSYWAHVDSLFDMLASAAR